MGYLRRSKNSMLARGPLQLFKRRPRKMNRIKFLEIFKPMGWASLPVTKAHHSFQSKVNTKHSQQRFWPTHENELIEIISSLVTLDWDLSHRRGSWIETRILTVALLFESTY